MAYIEGFLVPVPEGKKQAYLDMTRKTAPWFIDSGVTRIVECWGDDLKPGEQTDFFKAVAAEDGENVMFSWIEYPDKAARDAAHVKMQSDKRFAEEMEMPFDGKRMIFAGFVPIFDTAGTLA